MAGLEGRYVYDDYSLTLPNGSSVDLAALGFRYSARFDDQRDPLRYGSIDRGALRRVGTADPGARTAAAASPPLPRVQLSADEARRRGEEMARQVRIEAAAAPAGGPESQPFFTEHALAALGCRVPEGRGRYQDIAAPGIPDARAFLLNSKDGCVVELFNLVQRTDGGPGLWAGLRAQAAGEARRRGYQTEERDGVLGERSELRVFTQDGAYRGFWYAIESGTILYVLRVYSEQISVTPKLEALLREKLALAAE